MNERLKELAAEAGMYIVDDEFSTYGKFAEKFATLIIRDLVQQATYTRTTYENGIDESFPEVDLSLLKTLISEAIGESENIRLANIDCNLHFDTLKSDFDILVSALEDIVKYSPVNYAPKRAKAALDSIK
jgi:hypothetical protein